MKIQRDAHPICNSEYPYLIKAQQFGFFQSEQDDITSCDDWIVAVWIKELDDKYKKNDELFLKEVLPNFKKWLNNRDFKTYSGVGYGYSVLSMAQSLGIEINYRTAIMLSNSKLFDKMNSLLQPKESYFEQVLDRFEFEEILENLRRFNKLGLPFGKHIGDYYYDLLQLEKDLLECGKCISYSSLVFLDTCPREKYEKLFDIQRKISDEYGYDACNAKEIEILGALMEGENRLLYNKIDLQSQEINNYILNLTDTERDDIVTAFKPYIGQNVEISYLVIGEDGSIEQKKIIGEIKNVDFNGIDLKNGQVELRNFRTKESYSKGNDEKNHYIRYQYILTGGYINVDRYTDRKCIYYKTQKEIERLTNLTNKRYSAIRKMDQVLESGDILKRFWDKYGTIKGVVYLTESFETFMELVDRENAPIDNLFTSIFEKLYILGERNNLLQYSLMIYEKIISLSWKFPDAYRYGYAPSEFFPNEVKISELNLRAYTYGLDLKDFISPVLEKYIDECITNYWDEEILEDYNKALGGVKYGAKR